ncbi:MAG: hypothetical protein RH947_06265 [Alcanivorax sp.]
MENARSFSTFGKLLLLGCLLWTMKAAAYDDPPDGDHSYHEALLGTNIVSMSEQDIDGTFSVDFDSAASGFSCKQWSSGTGLITFNAENFRSVDMAYAFIANAIMSDKLSKLRVKVRLDEFWDSGARETVTCEAEGVSFVPNG